MLARGPDRHRVCKGHRLSLKVVEEILVTGWTDRDLPTASVVDAELDRAEFA